MKPIATTPWLRKSRHLSSYWDKGTGMRFCINRIRQVFDVPPSADEIQLQAFNRRASKSVKMILHHYKGPQDYCPADSWYEIQLPALEKTILNLWFLDEYNDVEENLRNSCTRWMQDKLGTRTRTIYVACWYR